MRLILPVEVTISGKYISSFVGMAPANNPKVSLIVTIEEPNSG